MNSKLIESLLYIRGEDGLSIHDYKMLTDLPMPTVREHLQAFMTAWNADANRGIQVVEYNHIFKFATRPEFHAMIGKLVSVDKKQRLSWPAIETAGIIAYKQPVTRSQINELRGVASEAVVNTLLIKGLIEEKGEAESVGHPLLYGITDKFYDYFQIKSLKELPVLSELAEPTNNPDGFDLFESQREQK